MQNRIPRAAALLAALLGTPSALAQDLNDNGLADSRDLRAGTSQDCNKNGFVDECDARVPHFSHAVEHLNGVEQFQNNVWDARPIEFNGDGRMDLVVTSMFSTNVGAVSLWRNEGGPGLVHVQRMQLNNTRPFAIRCADFNGDSLTDFVTSDASYNQAYVFFATGPETFAAPVTLFGPASNNGSVGLDVGDLDGDDDVDIVFSSWGLNSVNVFLNAGDGSFGPPDSYAVDFQPRDVAIADFTGDGWPDLAVANEYYAAGNPVRDGTVSLLANDGSGGFLPHATLTMPPGIPPYPGYARPQFLELVDVDNDDDEDLVTSMKYSNLLTVHHNDGAGNFSLAQVFGGIGIESEVRDVLVRDLDGDGWKDLVWGDVDMHMAAVYSNVGGVFEFRQNYATDNYGAFMVAAADFSGDGVPDLVTANETSRTFSILVNRGGLDFEAPIHLRPELYPSNPILVDFTGDGVTDLGMKHDVDLETVFSVYPGLGDAVFSKTSIDTPLSEGGVLLARDLNHDGKQDLLDVYGHCIALMGNGDGTFGPEVASNLSVAFRHVTADFDLDGELDLAWLVSGHPSHVRVSFGDGAGSFGPYAEYTDVREDESIGVGDITGDGAPEIFTGHRLGIFSIHPNLGNGNFGPRRDIFVPGAPFDPKIDAIAVADFDLDNDNDVVISGIGLQMFFNPGDGNLPEVPTTVAAATASILTVADIDLNGTPDLYARSYTGIVHLNSGLGFFDTSLFLKRYDSNARTMVVADANGDERPDVLIGPENSWGNYLFLNFPPVSTDTDGDDVPDECEPGPPWRAKRGPSQNGYIPQ